MQSCVCPESVVEFDYPAPTVFIVDDDPDVRRAIGLLARSVGVCSEQFAEPQEFLDRFRPDCSGCIVLDMRMPGMSGLELQKELSARDVTLPVIFISAFGEIPSVTSAMRAGAIDFITKPFSPQLLLERIQEAIALDERNRRARHEKTQLLTRMESLTDREREVMQLLAQGLSTKVIAMQLNISVKTVDNHRAKVLEKMGMDNPAQLARMISTIEFSNS